MRPSVISMYEDSWQQQSKYLFGALMIHLLLGVLLVGFNWRSHNAVVPQLAINAVLVDRNTLNQVVKRAAPTPPAPEPQVDQQEEKQKELEQQQKEQARLKQEQLKQDQLKQEQLKQQQLELQQTQEKERQRVTAADATKQQQQQADKKRIADIQQKQHDADMKRQADADAKAQSAKEAELKAQLAAEEGRDNAVNAGLLNQYVALIQQKVMRNWIKPPTAKSGLECEVKVAQASGGMVLSVEVGRCNGDAAVRTSIEQAVQRASPLPSPPDPRLFERNLLFIFKPTE
jgi:colicin import membrane protein